MLLNGCSPISGSVYATPMALHAKTYVPSSRFSAPFQSFGIRNSRGTSRAQIVRFSRGKIIGLKLSVSLTPLLRPLLPTACGGKSLIPPNAVKNFQAPKMSKKPEWWWRALASLPYLIPIHRPLFYAFYFPTVYNVYPFLENIEFLTEPFFRAYMRLPWWFPIAYSYVITTVMIKKKACPHFFRFHVMMGMLMEIGLTVMESVCRLVPLSVLFGKIGTHFWTSMALAYMFVVLECIRCALNGSYPSIPLMSETAILHTSTR